MKTSKILFIAIVTAASSAAFCQTNPPASANPAQSGTVPMNGDPRPLTDQAMSQRLSSDLSGRNTQVGTNPVDWFDTGNGYYGTYSVGGDTYMSRYDKQGKFLDTYTKGNWDDSNTPSSLKSSFGKSDYKNQQVTGFWTSSDNSNYYLETKDQSGKVSRVYSDQGGTFSKTAPKSIKTSAPRQ